MSPQTESPLVRTVVERIVSPLRTPVGNGVEYDKPSRYNADLCHGRVVHIVRITTTEERIFRTVLALANVIEANPANDWATVHDAWSESRGSCMTLLFSREYSCARLALEMRRIVHPDAYRFHDGPGK